MYDVFVSYPRLERNRAETFKALSLELGLSVFFDVESIDGGRVFPDIISRALDEAKVVLACCSPVYFTRQWCLIEAREGLAREILVPVVVEHFARQVPPADLRQINYFDFAGWDGDKDADCYRQLLRSMSKLMGRDLQSTSGAGLVSKATPSALPPAKRIPERQDTPNSRASIVVNGLHTADGSPPYQDRLGRFVACRRSGGSALAVNNLYFSTEEDLISAIRQDSSLSVRMSTPRGNNVYSTKKLFLSGQPLS